MYTIYDFTFVGVLLSLILIYIVRDFFRNGKRITAIRILFYSFLFYLLIVAKLTMGSIIIPLLKDNVTSTQFVPFYFLKELFLRYRYDGLDWSFWNSLKLSFFNLIMLMPLAFYLFFFKIRKKAKAFLIIFLVSFLIELSQLIFTYAGLIRPRTFNVDDLILNSTGGFIAFLLIVFVKYFASRHLFISKKDLSLRD